MSKIWKTGIVKDQSKPMLGLHATHTTRRPLPERRHAGIRPVMALSTDS